jgi:hypothetical protein
MRQHIKARLASAAAVVGVVGVALAPVAASAATATANTTINAVIASVISITTSGTVTLNITPVSGGAQTSASDTVSVSTNNATGYNLKLEDNDATVNLVNGANTITAHAGTYATPTALANNTWGYAVGALNNFDASYSVLTNVTSSATKWAGVPVSGSGQQIKTTATTASGDTTTVWYSAKADTTKPNGTYTDTVVYTATTNP